MTQHDLVDRLARPACPSVAAGEAALKDAARRARARWPREGARPSLTAAPPAANRGSGRGRKTALQPNRKTLRWRKAGRTTHPLQTPDIFTRHRHLAQNAIHHAPSHAIRSVIGAELRAVWNAKDLDTANAELRLLVQRYTKSAPALSQWLERNVLEGLAVFSLPEQHRPKMRTSNPVERTVHQEIKRGTVKVRVFPNIDAPLRLVSAVLVEIDEKWAASTQPYIKWKPDTASTV